MKIKKLKKNIFSPFNKMTTLKEIFMFPIEKIDQILFNDKKISINEKLSIETKRKLVVEKLIKDDKFVKDKYSNIEDLEKYVESSYNWYDFLSKTQDKKFEYEYVSLKHEYVVINTGYTQKLLNKKTYKKFTSSWDYIVGDKHNDMELLIVYGDDSSKPTIVNDNGIDMDKFINNLKKMGIFQNGIAVFKCSYENSHYLYDSLESDGRYCLIFEEIDRKYFKNNFNENDSILYVEYDSEHG